MAAKNLQELRRKIDLIDSKLLKLLSYRGKLASQIGEVKKRDNADIHVPAREAQILNKITRENKGPFSNAAIKTLFREILSASLALEEPIKVSYLGPQASFSHIASLKQFGRMSVAIPVDYIKDVFENVEKGVAKYGVVPVENSNEGTVTQTVDLFLDYPLKICGEILMRINHNLLNISGKNSDIKKIISHPQPIAQCREWISRNMPGIPVEEVSSTATAAVIASKDKYKAAIASEMAMKIYDLKMVHSHIEDNCNNFTRFVIIGKESFCRTGDDKTSLMFTTKDRAGALNDVLKHFAANRISLSKIESRPSKKKPWEYIFFVDCRGHMEDLPVKKTIMRLEKDCVFLTILGSYPRGKLD
ncbi:MAG: prephenate dehydratase [Candidatus Schekmanbacteria bacterium]|nr:prephenate dehydratase [Candidatus Schekmanbacteria bacterium]